MGEIICVEGIIVPIGSHLGRRIIIGADHRGFNCKNAIKERLIGLELFDVGTFFNDRCDYPMISDEIGRQICEDPSNSVGIGICGSGMDILIPASRYRGVYSARCLRPEEAKTSRKHNNTNLLVLDANYMGLEEAIATINAWLNTPFYSDPLNEGVYLNRFLQTVKLEAEIMNKINYLNLYFNSIVNDSRQGN